MFVSGGLIPIYLTVKQLGLVDTFWVMVVPFAVSPYNIVVARTFFNNSIPEGMWEAAQIRWVRNHSLLQKDRAPLVQGYYCRYWTLDSSRDLEFLVQCLDLFDQ